MLFYTGAAAFTTAALAFFSDYEPSNCEARCRFDDHELKMATVFGSHPSPLSSRSGECYGEVVAGFDAKYATPVPVDKNTWYRIVLVTKLAFAYVTPGLAGITDWH